MRYEAERVATQKKTARLGALRDAKEAADTKAADETPAKAVNKERNKV